MSTDTKYQGRTNFEADSQKRKLYEIGVSLLKIEKAEYKENEFSTIVIFNYTEKPLKAPLEMMLLGFVELNDFLKLDVNGLYRLIAGRYENHKKRLKKPTKQNA